MCENCEKLIGMPGNKKACVVLVNDYPDYPDYDYGPMVLKQYSDGCPLSFTTPELKIPSTQRIYGIGDIKFCPFCGEKLY